MASGGGHWDELMLLRPALEQYSPTYVTTHVGLAVRDGLGDALIMLDANRDQPGPAIRCLMAAFRIVWAERPDVLITTGALPGLFCLVFARMIGARTVWIDSIANSDAPSLSGRIARPFSSLWLTQWEHLADGRKQLFRGALW